MLVKLGSSSPIFGVKMSKHIWVATNNDNDHHQVTFQPITHWPPTVASQAQGSEAFLRRMIFWMEIFQPASCEPWEIGAWNPFPWGLTKWCFYVFLIPETKWKKWHKLQSKILPPVRIIALTQKTSCINQPATMEVKASNKLLGGSAKSTHLVKNQPTAWAQGFREKSTQSGKVAPKNTKPNGHTRIGHVFRSSSIYTKVCARCRILAILIDLNIALCLYLWQINRKHKFRISYLQWRNLNEMIPFLLRVFG